MKSKLEILADDEVISAINPKITKKIDLPSTAKVSEIIVEVFMDGLPENLVDLIFNNFECQALRYGQNEWQKGKLKICLAFIPESDESADLDDGGARSPLDTIRNR